MPAEPYGVDSARFAEPSASADPARPRATALAADADWVTLDECNAKFESGFSANYWYKNKFSWCRSQVRAYPIVEVPSGKPIADVWHTLTYIGNGGNRQRTLDLHVRISNWEEVVYDQAQWNAIRPGLIFRFFPTCVALPGSACGDIFPLGVPYVEFPAMTNGTRDYWYLPTTFVAAPEDNNPQDMKGYYLFSPQLRVIHTADLVTPTNNLLPQDSFRCDSASYGGSLGSGGCIFTNIASFISIDANEAGIRESACLIKDAFDDITRTYPGVVGTFVPGEYQGTHGPLTRNYYQNGGIRNDSRTVVRNACSAGYGEQYTWRVDGQRNECDEFPFAVTYENANAPFGGTARRFAVRPVLSEHNSRLGSRLGSYYASDRILDGDSYYVKVSGSCPTWAWSAPPGTTKKLMVVGDSISQGNEGDYTWRYRLASHLVATGANVNFVGPYAGTTRLPPEQPPGFPAVSAPVVFDAAYRNGIGFDSDHFAQWGRQAAQAKNDIRARVAEYRPDYLLVELGFNDLGWGVSTPDGLIADMMTIIAEARFSNPAIRILVANVVHRTPLPNVPNLPQITDEYNGKLGPMLALVNSAQSPVRLVDIDGAIIPSLDTSDGLHPSGVGEYRIARAFANVLASQFSLGQAFGAIPASVPDLVPAAPASMTATATPVGIDLRWAHSFGAAGYWLHQRDVTAGTVGIPFERLPLPIPADSWRVGWVQAGHRYEYYVVPMRGIVEGSASAIASAVANPVTAAGPTNIIVTPSTSFVDFSWTRPTGPFSETVNAYMLYYFDQNAFGAIVQQQRVNSTSYRLSGLVGGHRYTFVVASINASGEGFPAAGPEAVFGFGRPGASTITSAKILSPTDVELRWTAVPGATSYIILNRDFVAGAPFNRASVVTGTSQTIGWLFPGSDRWEWCVIAANGSLEGPTSACTHSQGSI